MVTKCDPLIFTPCFQFHHVAAWELVWAASYRGLWREALKQVNMSHLKNVRVAAMTTKMNHEL